MRIKNKYLVPFLFALLMMLALVLINEKQKNIYNAHPPDIERLIGLSPDGWYPVESNFTSPVWLNSAQEEYDMVKVKTYRNKQGQEVTVVMTWGRNGIQKAGHVQQLCYSAQGFSVSGEKNILVQINADKILVTNFVASQMGQPVEEVFYWRITDGKLLNNIQYTGLDDERLSHRILRMREVLKYLFTNVPDNIMVRVSARKYDYNESAEAPVNFIKEYLEHLSSKDLKLLTGL